jgi:hypothetical protein
MAAEAMVQPHQQSCNHVEPNYTIAADRNEQQEQQEQQEQTQNAEKEGRKEAPTSG